MSCFNKLGKTMLQMTRFHEFIVLPVSLSKKHNRPASVLLGRRAERWKLGLNGLRSPRALKDFELTSYVEVNSKS